MRIQSFGSQASDSYSLDHYPYTWNQVTAVLRVNHVKGREFIQPQ